MTTRLILVILAPLLAFAGGDPARFYAEARKAEADRDFAVAVARYEQVLDLDEDYEDAYERWDECQRCLPWQKALRGAPTAPDLVALGELRLGTEGERRCYEDAIRLDPDCSDAHGHLALLAYTTRGGSFAEVYRETLEFLRRSPNRARLGETIEDFEIYGALRNLDALLGPTGKEVRDLIRAKEWVKAAGLLQEARAGPEGVRQWCAYQAGVCRDRAGDRAGARREFGAVLVGPPSILSLYTHLALARLDGADGHVRAALGHLVAAVREGSRACRLIRERRDTDFAPVFASTDPAIVETRERLLDETWADAPIRAAIDAACERAGKEGKRVLLHWYGPYCPYVMAMQERLADPRVRAKIAESFVYVRMDQGSMHRGLTLDDEYGDVMARQGVPSFFVLDPDGSVVTVEKDLALTGAPHRCYSVEKILAWLQGVSSRTE